MNVLKSVENAAAPLWSPCYLVSNANTATPWNTCVYQLCESYVTVPRSITLAPAIPSQYAKDGT